jgi:GMP synthase (glutamine-hydrolysing)
MDTYLKNEIEEVHRLTSGRDVLLLISGGVDSTVVGGLLLKALPPSRVHLMYIDTGLMRKEESVEVEVGLKKLGAQNLYLIDASERFLTALKGVSDPEEKRSIIGDLFMRVQEDEIDKRLGGSYLLAQGTLYTDLIESGKGIGKKAQVIKSHHNVRSPLVEAKREAGLIIEPLSKLYKDEVRRLGLKIGISAEIIRRHPFPGPGLAVRIIGDVTEEKCRILRDADYIYVNELKTRGLYDEIWQAFCVLLPVRSVGVAGDIREYGYVLALRAITSSDGMTADVYPFESGDILEISSLITNSVKGIGRVVYDVSSKPPATIEWE